MKKGISPVIASVIMIAVAVSIGIIVSTWITHLVEQQISEDELCAIDTLYNINSAKFNISGNNNILIKITNDGEDGLYGFGVVMDNGTIILLFNSTDYRLDQGNISSTKKLGRKQSLYLVVNMTNTTSEKTDYQGFAKNSIE